MATSLLATKFNIPPIRPHLVTRLRLIERLQEGLHYNLILVCAPPGFGKTTFLSEWVHKNQERVHTAWVSLEKGDNDPVRFWDYFIAALQTLQPDCGEKILPLLHSPQPLSTEPMLTALINDLYRVKGDFVIVLDDYHLIESQQIHDGIIYLIEHLPAQVHLVIATCADPPLSLVHLYGKDVMLDIRTDDLRFSTDDAASLLKEMKTPGLSEKDVAALNERTEGWVAGLKMAALSIRGQKDIPGFIAAFTGSQRYVMDYLMEEVLRKQSQEVRDFLMKTSVLERLSAPLCDVVTERKDSQDILLSFERSGLFIVPLDEIRQWYRYEHLFVELLRHQCEKVYGTEQVAALHQQSSQWYEDNNLPDEATHHALEARDWERATRLIYTHYEARRNLGEFNTLFSWFQMIPDEILREHLCLYTKYADLLSTVGQLDAAEAALGYLESTAHDTALEGNITFSRGFVYGRRGDMKRYLELMEKAFALLPPDNVVMRGRAAVCIAHAKQRFMLLRETEEWSMIAYELGQQAGDIFTASLALVQIFAITVYQGKLKRAVEFLKRETEFGGQTAGREILCMVQYILNELEGTMESAKLAVGASELRGAMSGAIPALYCQAQVCLARGDEVGAATAMERMDQASRHPSVDSFWYADYIANHVVYAMQQGNLEEAARWVEQLPDTDSMLPFDRYVPARLLLAQGKRKEAARLLQELYDGFSRSGYILLAGQIRIYQALALDDEEQALEFLAEALTIAEPEGAIRFFVDESILLKPLLKKALAQKITPEFTRKLINIIEYEERRYKTSDDRVNLIPETLEFLSQRELEVLRLIAEGLTNKQITRKLSVSQNTLKTHIRHLFEKLDANNRLQAVKRGKELKLI